MLPYRVVFHDEDGAPVAESAASHPNDGAAVDNTGRHSHPHEIHVWQGDRFVARVPPKPKAAKAPGGRRRPWRPDPTKATAL
jgi:hypothetical protein